MAIFQHRSARLRSNFWLRTVQDLLTVDLSNSAMALSRHLDMRLDKYDIYMWIHEVPPRPSAWLLIEKEEPRRVCYVCPAWNTFSGLHGRGVRTAMGSQLHLSFRYLGDRAPWLHRMLLLQVAYGRVFECSFCFRCGKRHPCPAIVLEEAPGPLKLYLLRQQLWSRL